MLDVDHIDWWIFPLLFFVVVGRGLCLSLVSFGVGRRLPLLCVGCEVGLLAFPFVRGLLSGVLGLFLARSSVRLLLRCGGGVYVFMVFVRLLSWGSLAVCSGLLARPLIG